MDYKTFEQFQAAYEKALAERKADMLRLQHEGLSLLEIGERWGLTRQRVGQILGLLQDQGQGAASSSTGL